MFWKIYVWIFAGINILSLISYDFSSFQVISLISLILSCLLNIAVFSYAYGKKIFSGQILNYLFKANIGLFGLFLLFEFVTFLQEVVGSVGIALPSSGVVSIIASFPSLPALYAAYKLAHPKASKKKKK